MPKGKGQEPDAGRRWTWGDPIEPLRVHLRDGGVAAIPSESSYGLAVDPRSAEGVEAIYRLKSRERGKPLLVVAADIDQLACLGIDPDSPLLRALGRAWPAPLTAIVPLDAPLPAAAGGATLAVRIPAHERLRGLLADVGFPLTATSANTAGEPPILDPALLELWLGEVQSADSQGPADSPVILCDDGSLPGGPPSTLVALGDGGWKILRQGAFAADRLPDPPIP